MKTIKKIAFFVIGIVTAWSFISADPTGVAPDPTGSAEASTSASAPPVLPMYRKIGVPPAEVETQKIVVDEVDGKKRITTWKKSLADPNNPGQAGNGVWYPVNSIEPKIDGADMVIQSGVDINQNTAVGIAKPAPQSDLPQPEPSAAPSSSGY